MKILVVDDNQDCANANAILLRLWGHSVVCAYDGPSGLAEMSANKPDLVLLNLGLPGIDGFKVAKQIRARKQDEKMNVIALTGHGRQEGHLLQLIGWNKLCQVSVKTGLSCAEHLPRVL